MSKIWMLCDFTKEAYIQYACQKELHNTWTKSIEIEKKKSMIIASRLYVKNSFTYHLIQIQVGDFINHPLYIF